jgi:release factor glutamine methyltransferase
VPNSKRIAQQLQEGLTDLYGALEARSMLRIVYEDVLGLYRLQRPLTDDQEAKLRPIQQRLLRGEPLQYVLGQADFYGYKFKVDPAVLIPRQETEELVYMILEQQGNKPLRLLDVGTGSGCIPITLKLKRPAWQVEAVDVSPEALQIAADNAQRLGADVRLQQLDILDTANWPTLPPYDIIVSNPPYIPPSETKHVPPHVLEHEPHLALFTETEDALVFYRAIAAFARQQLRPGGWLYFELNEFNGEQVLEVVESQGFNQVGLERDLNGKSRMLKGQL